MSRLTELEMRVGARAATRKAACSEQSAPVEATGRARYKALNDVITAAFICGSSRIAVMGVREMNSSPMTENGYQEVAQKWESGGQAKLVEANRNVFSEVFVD
jgi:hypothetical protein